MISIRFQTEMYDSWQVALLLNHWMKQDSKFAAAIRERITEAKTCQAPNSDPSGVSG